MGIAALVAVGLIVVWVIAAYNGLIAKRVSTDNAWSQIDVQLKRRHDLIPNLIEVVKGYAAHERETLDRVISARSAAVSAQGIPAQTGAEQALSGALKGLLAISESYPDLKANTQFQQLHEELSSTENRIGFARQHYNDSVGVYQTALQSFPSNILAGMFRFESKPFFEPPAEEKAAMQKPPQVKFS